VLHCADPSRGCGVPFIRAIGRWTMTALVINSIIGSGIFGLPSEVTRLVGRASPLAMIFGGLAMGIIMACLAEVASQFSEPGGVYLYVRTAFGRFAGMQAGWFHLLAACAGGAANASLFMIYLAGLLPWAGGGTQHALLLALLIIVPTAANYVGVRSGAAFSNLLTIAKLLPLGLIIALGIARFGHHIEILKRSEISSPGIASWLSALFLLFFAYGGPENALVPAGEVKNPRQTVPFGLLAGLVVCAAVYTLVQFVTVATIGASTTPRPLAETASVLVGQEWRNITHDWGDDFCLWLVIWRFVGSSATRMLTGSAGRCPRVSWQVTSTLQNACTRYRTLRRVYMVPCGNGRIPLDRGLR